MKQFIGILIIITLVCCLSFCEPKINTSKPIINKKQSIPHKEDKPKNDPQPGIGF